MDLAFSTQYIYEKIFFNILQKIESKKKNHNLCLSGGCSLNSLANGKIYEQFNFKNIYMPPASGDAKIKLSRFNFFT